MTASPPPLHGTRVVELSSNYAAGLTGRFLQGYGSSVTHVDMAAYPGLTDDERTYLHHGKHRADPADIVSLLSTANIVLSDLQPAQLKALGIDWAKQRADHPAQLIVSVTPFGLTGPYADHHHTNAVSFALGGIMGLTGDAERSPLVTGGNHAYALAGLNAFGAAVTGWFGVQRHGRGDVVDISGQECAAGMLEYYGPWGAYHQLRIQRLGNHTRATWGIFPCLDGWAGAFCLERQVPALFALLDDPELDEPRFRNPLERVLPENEDELTVKLYLWFSDKTKEELRRISLATRVPIGIATTPLELLGSDGFLRRRFFDTFDAGPGEQVSMPGRPFPGFGWQGESPAHPPAAAPTPDPSEHAELPLSGVRVIDLTMMWAGPFATLRMAEMGADVIKVESPSAWDNIRTLLPQPDVEDPWNSSVYFNAYNRDKRSLTLDLAQQEGRELLLRLVAKSDVLIENYRADVLDKLGLSYDVLRRVNPRIVVVSMAAFGKEGPDRDYVGFGPVIELMSGLVSLSGYGDGEPFKTGVSYGDPVAGTAAVAATTLALLDRERTGEGAHIDLAQSETAAVLIGEAFVAASRGETPVHRGCRDARFAPQGCYRTGDHGQWDDQWMVISVRNDSEWRSLCDVLELAPHDPMRAYGSDQRHLHHAAIDAIIAAWTSGKQPGAAMEALQESGVPAGRVLDNISVHEDAQLTARRYWVELPNPKMHPYGQQGSVWHFADSNPQPRRHAPFFGEHNAEILKDLLGVDDAALQVLRSNLVIADAPINPGVG